MSSQQPPPSQAPSSGVDASSMRPLMGEGQQAPTNKQPSPPPSDMAIDQPGAAPSLSTDKSLSMGERQQLPPHPIERVPTLNFPPPGEEQQPQQQQLPQPGGEGVKTSDVPMSGESSETKAAPSTSSMATDDDASMADTETKIPDASSSSTALQGADSSDSKQMPLSSSSDVPMSAGDAGAEMTESKSETGKRTRGASKKTSEATQGRAKRGKGAASAAAAEGELPTAPKTKKSAKQKGPAGVVCKHCEKKLTPAKLGEVCPSTKVHARPYSNQGPAEEGRSARQKVWQCCGAKSATAAGCSGGTPHEEKNKAPHVASHQPDVGGEVLRVI